MVWSVDARVVERREELMLKCARMVRRRTSKRGGMGVREQRITGKWREGNSTQQRSQFALNSM